MLDDPLAEIADAQHHLARTVPCQQAQLVVHERLAADLEQRLREVLDEPAEPGGETAGKDANRRERIGHGAHGH